LSANYVTATVASHLPGFSLKGASEVTYSTVDLKLAGGIWAGLLFAPVAGAQYYSDRLWNWPSQPGQLFTPFPATPKENQVLDRHGSGTNARRIWN